MVVTGAPLYDWVPQSVGCLLTLGASPQVSATVVAVLSGQKEAGGSIKGLT